MGYAVYEDRDNNRWAGYGVPAECDQPGCAKRIDRGLAFKCEEHVSLDPDAPADEVITEGCGLFFCESHHYDAAAHDRIPEGKPDSPEWVHHMLTDESWQPWRDLNPITVQKMREATEDAR